MNPLQSLCQFLAVALLCAGCTVPPSRESFCRRPDGDGNYTFNMEFLDSTASYDLFLCTGFDCTDDELSSAGTLPIEVTAVSPEGKRFKETVYFPLKTPVRDTYNKKEYISLYRSNLSGLGVWRLSVKPVEPDRLAKGFRGFGIQMKIRNGER